MTNSRTLFLYYFLASTKITAPVLMEKVLEIEDKDNQTQAGQVATATARPAAAVTTKPEVAKPEQSKEAAAKSKAEKKPEKSETSKESKDKGTVLSYYVIYIIIIYYTHITKSGK